MVGGICCSVHLSPAVELEPSRLLYNVMHISTMLASDASHVPWSDVLSMLGAPVGIAGIAAVNFILTALCLDALPATASVASIPIATHLAGIGLLVSPGAIAVASIALPAIGAASLLYYSLYRTRRSKALK